MTHRGPFQPLPFCDSVTVALLLMRSETSLHSWDVLFTACHSQYDVLLPQQMILFSHSANSIMVWIVRYCFLWRRGLFGCWFGFFNVRKNICNSNNSKL